VFKRRKPDEPPGAGSLSVFQPGRTGLNDDSTQGGSADRQGAPTGPADSGLGVPPFRPAPLKEAPNNMARTPFSSSPQPASQPTPTMPPPPGASPPQGARPAIMPGGPRPVRDPAERRTLVVGRGISVQGTVQDAERLVVEGTVEASMIHATELAISPGGVFKGEVEVEDAEIAGTIDGTLTVRAGLVVRSTGRVLGTARCRRLQVEDGGQITGRIEMLTDGAAPRPEPVRATPEPATSAD
jgi:cytoskeletal protein CcmA (bactofilin family)